MNKKKVFLIIALILAASALLMWLIFSTEPEAKQETTSKKTAMLVNVVEVEKGDYKPVVVATGTVQASKDITLSSQVAGEVVSISKNFTPGANVKKGEVLLQINPADFRNTLQFRQSDLDLAEADLRVEMGRQDVAKKDYELIGDELSEENKSLVLREPQLQQARANVRSAKAAVEQARLNLSRTTIRAPFDAHIISRNINEGSQVAIGNPLGRLVGVDEYWVISNVPISKVNWLNFVEEEGTEGSRVLIQNDQAWPSYQKREGQLFRLVGALDNQTRLARVITVVNNPLATGMNTDSIPPLMIGTFVETLIDAKELKQVIKLSLDYVRKDDDVWVMKDGKLEIRDVEIVFKDAEHAYITAGLEDGEQVVTTQLSTVVSGSPLRVESAEEGSATSTEETDEGSH